MTKRESRAAGQRQLRVAEQVRHALATVLERGEIRDPGLEGVSVTVSEVRMPPDLRRAKVYVSRLGGGDTGPILDALARARPYLRHRVAGLVRLKFAPDLAFESDTVFDAAEQVERLFRDPKVARDLDRRHDNPDGGHGT